MMSARGLTYCAPHTTYSSLFRYPAFILQLSSGLSPLKYPVVLLSVDVERLLLLDLGHGSAPSYGHALHLRPAVVYLPRGGRGEWGFGETCDYY